MEITGDRIVFHIDHPADWRLAGRGVAVRGWGFTRDGQALTGVRLVAPEIVLPGILGLPRPDVRSALPEAPGDNTGFEIRGLLPAGHYPVRLELCTSDGDWHAVAVHTVGVPRPLLPAWLGGGSSADLVAFQMPGHMKYSARPIASERFPTHRKFSRPPALAIVTPSYGHARFLEETIRSVLEQPADVQYVIQDGGSADGSVEVIKRHADRLHAWDSSPDDGQADALARGFARTSGGPDDLMAWINSDDFYLPDALGFVADHFARHPDVDVIYGHRILVDEHSREVGRWFLPKHDPEVLRLNDFVPQETLFWRRRIWDKVGGIDTSLQFAMDWDLLLRFQAAGARIVRVPYFLGCFRLHAAQKTSAQMHSRGQQEIDRLRARAHGREIPPAELESDPRLLRYLRRSAFIEFLWSLGIRAPR